MQIRNLVRLLHHKNIKRKIPYTVPYFTSGYLRRYKKAFLNGWNSALLVILVRFLAPGSGSGSAILSKDPGPLHGFSSSGITLNFPLSVLFLFENYVRKANRNVDVKA